MAANTNHVTFQAVIIGLLTYIQRVNCGDPSKFTFLLFRPSLRVNHERKDFNFWGTIRVEEKKQNFILFFVIILRPTFVNLEDRYGHGNLSDSTLETLRGRFEPRGSEFPADFETWNNLRQSDGFLCRFDEDCLWILDAKGGLAGLKCLHEDVNASVSVEVRYRFNSLLGVP